MEIIYSSVRPQHLERDLGNCISHKSSILKFTEKKMAYSELNIISFLYLWVFCSENA